MEAQQEHTHLERLPELYARLKAHDFVVTIDRWQAFNDLLIQLQLQRRLPQTEQDFRALACPLFASNAREQQAFTQLFSLWWQEKSLQASPRAAVKPIPEQVQQRREYEKKSSATPWIVLSLTACIAVLMGLIVAFQPMLSPPPPQPAVAIPEKLPAVSESSAPVASGESMPLQPLPFNTQPEPFTVEVDTTRYQPYIPIIIQNTGHISRDRLKSSTWISSHSTKKQKPPLRSAIDVKEMVVFEIVLRRYCSKVKVGVIDKLLKH